MLQRLLGSDPSREGALNYSCTLKRHACLESSAVRDARFHPRFYRHVGTRCYSQFGFKECRYTRPISAHVFIAERKNFDAFTSHTYTCTRITGGFTRDKRERDRCSRDNREIRNRKSHRLLVACSKEHQARICCLIFRVIRDNEYRNNTLFSYFSILQLCHARRINAIFLNDDVIQFNVLIITFRTFATISGTCKR